MKTLVLVVVVLCCAHLIVGQIATDPTQTTQPTRVPPPTETLAPTETPKPTNPPTETPRPTDTLPPTETPKPTNPPTNAPTPCAPTPSPKPPRKCISQGDPHFTTFDGLHYDYQGIGDFLLTYFSGTAVYSRQYSCAPGVACNAGVAVRTSNGDKLQIIGDIVTYNGLPAVVPVGSPVTYSFVPLLRILKTAPSVYTISIDDGKVEWTYRTITVWITTSTVPTPWWGLCSNNTRCFRVPIPGVPGPRIQDTAGEWRVDERESGFFYTADEPWDKVNQPDAPQHYGPFETDDPVIIRAYTEACASLVQGSLVEQCRPFVSPKLYYEDCKNDIIATGGNTDFARAAIDAYAAVCADFLGTATGQGFDI